MKKGGERVVIKRERERQIKTCVKRREEKRGCKSRAKRKKSKVDKPWVKEEIE